MKGRGSQALTVYLLHAIWSECQEGTLLDNLIFVYLYLSASSHLFNL